ncbi:MAG: hypothetical protein ACJ76X_08685 [Solirubrobacteraceae bacterium]|jgi:hypothetical protein
MKRTSTISVRVAALGLMVALAAGLTSSATAGTLAHTSKAKPKLKAISCKALIAPSLLTHEVTVDTGIAPVVNPATEINDTHQRGTLAGVPLRQCALYWGNADGTGNATAYGYCAGCQPPAIWWTAGTAVTTRQFNRLYADESVNGSFGNQTGPPFVKEHIPSLGNGSRAFLEPNNEKDADINPLYQTDNCLYVLSKGKHGKPGNLLILCAWPLSLQREKQIVQALLSHHRF